VVFPIAGCAGLLVFSDVLTCIESEPKILDGRRKHASDQCSVRFVALYMFIVQINLHLGIQRDSIVIDVFLHLPAAEAVHVLR
jgi:hypothetical protein